MIYSYSADFSPTACSTAQMATIAVTPDASLKTAIAVTSVAKREMFNILKRKALSERAHAELPKQVTLLAAYWHCEQRQSKKDQKPGTHLLKHLAVFTLGKWAHRNGAD